MNRNVLRSALALLALFGLCGISTAGTVGLFDYGVYLDGQAEVWFQGEDPSLIPGIDLSGFGGGFPGSFPGSVTVGNITGPGSHTVGAFFDFDIDDALNTFWNEYGEAVGVAPAGIEWEIDEPGFLFGDIVFDNFYNGAPDNTNAVPSSLPEDVSFALFGTFTLNGALDSAAVTFNITDTVPNTPFYLVHGDDESTDLIYASILVDITVDPGGGPGPGPGPIVPVPSAALIGLSLLGALGAIRGVRKLKR